MIPLLKITSLEINTIVTVISIVYAIYKGIRAKKAQQKLNSYELVSYKDKYHDLYIKLTKVIRQEDWNKGGKSNEILSNLEESLRDFNKFNNKIQSNEQYTINKTIKSALKHIDSVFKGIDYYIPELLSNLDDIDKKLQSICNELISN